MAKKGYDAGVKEYRDTYWIPENTPNDTDILACFKTTSQPGVPRLDRIIIPSSTMSSACRKNYRHFLHR